MCEVHSAILLLLKMSGRHQDISDLWILSVVWVWMYLNKIWDYLRAATALFDAFFNTKKLIKILRIKMERLEELNKHYSKNAPRDVQKRFPFSRSSRQLFKWEHIGMFCIDPNVQWMNMETMPLQYLPRMNSMVWYCFDLAFSTHSSFAQILSFSLRLKRSWQCIHLVLSASGCI